MGGKIHRSWSSAAWSLARRQHYVLTREQLLELGLSRYAIAHRLQTGRLHRVWRGVYAVGRPQLTPQGRWIAAVLACGPAALLGHRSAAELWGLLGAMGYTVHVVVPAKAQRSRPGIRVHRRTRLGIAERVERHRIPVTSPAARLIDLAADREPRLEEALANADRLNLIDPETLRGDLNARTGEPGGPRPRELLDRHTYTRTDSVLERWFLKIVAAAGLPYPETQVELNGFRVDFFWPQFGLVVETDGLRYHRTPAQQTRDLQREQAHAAAGLRYLRFSAAQVRHDPASVRKTLIAVLSANQKLFAGRDR